mgnify:CR=1 FL=1
MRDMARRILFFILTNIMVLVTIGIVLSVIASLTGYGWYLESGTINLVSLLIFSAVVGFTGALVSLAMSRWMAKQVMGVKVLDPDGPLSDEERRLVETVHRLSRSAGLTHMPEVGIYHSPEVNAFATGPTKKRSLVAVSSGLLETMDERAVEGVLAHEVAHIANGDMVTMTLLQGVVNTFVVFLARLVAFTLSRFVKEELQPIVHFIAIIIFELLFAILGSIVVMAYSRYREFHADKGGADLAGKDKMIHALRSLKAYVERVDTSQTSMQTLKINNKPSLIKLFASHPDLDERIQRLETQ